jgi:HTH-type transcriptional regulator/antitoxin HipB
MPTQVNSLRDLIAAARGRRLDLGLSQAELAARAHVSRQWISQFEAGKPAAELGLVIRLLDALGLRLSLTEDGHSAAGDQPSSSTTIDLDVLLDDYRDQ